MPHSAPAKLTPAIGGRRGVSAGARGEEVAMTGAAIARRVRPAYFGFVAGDKVGAGAVSGASAGGAVAGESVGIGAPSSPVGGAAGAAAAGGGVPGLLPSALNTSILAAVLSS